MTPRNRVYREICLAYFGSGVPPSLEEVAHRLDRHITTVRTHVMGLRRVGMLHDPGPEAHRALVPAGEAAATARFSGEVLTLANLGHSPGEIADSFGVSEDLVESVMALQDRIVEELPCQRASSSSTGVTVSSTTAR